MIGMWSVEGRKVRSGRHRDRRRRQAQAEGSVIAPRDEGERAPGASVDTASSLRHPRAKSRRICTSVDCRGIIKTILQSCFINKQRMIKVSLFISVPNLRLRTDLIVLRRNYIPLKSQSCSHRHNQLSHPNRAAGMAITNYSKAVSDGVIDNNFESPRTPDSVVIVNIFMETEQVPN